ncbi:MAG: adenylate/guanylate cyclase domain-containing protein [Actinomycetota bacterium]
MPACPSCGEMNPIRARFCMACAEPLPPLVTPATGETRKTLTIVFCDVVGSTPLGERLDPESVRKVMTGFYERMRTVLEHHGGSVEKYIGDAVMAVFGVPELHEDDALRAVRAASEMREALGALNAELEPALGVSLRTRIGVNTGQVVVGDHRGGPLVVGDTVNVAARLEQAAGPGEILLGARTYALVRGAVTVDEGRALSLKGKADPVTGYRLLSVEGVPGATDRLRPGFVGRLDELEALGAAFDRSVDGTTCVLLTMLGVAGVGKSRLSEEFSASLGDRARVIGGRCLPYGDGITFWPVAELVKDACGIGGDDPRELARRKILDALAGADDAEAIADGVAAVSGFGDTSATMQETFWSIRRFLETLQRDRPLVVVFDDIHWAEPTLLDLVEYLAGWCRDARILLLCLGRPELLDLRPGWATVEPTAGTLTLSLLTAEECERLIDDLLGASPLDPADSARIVAAAEGNPLFVEEMLRMLEDDGLLARDDEGWRVAGDLSSVAVPATIQALLSARLDRLDPHERAVLGTAAVIGKEFWWGAVADLAPEELRPLVGSRLQTLVRKGLIMPERSSLAGEDAFRFHHILIQDASYQALPKERRAELHERLAGWIEGHAGDRTLEYEEVVGYHLEQAYRYRTELGETGAGPGKIAARAAERLASAGRRALARGDMVAAVTLLDRAVALYHDDVRARATLLPDLSEALMQTGDFARAGEVLDEATRSAEIVGDRGLLGHATIVRLLLMESTDPKGLEERAPIDLAAVIPVFEELGDDLGLARAWRLRADLHWTRARYADAGEALERAIEHARAAGSAWEEAELLGQYTGAGVYGPVPVDRLVERCETVLARGKGNRAVDARALRSLAAARAMQGRFAEARDLAAKAASILVDLGLWLPAAFASETRGFVERLAGDLEGAELALREGYEGIAKLEEQGYQSTVAALLAHVLLELGRIDEAERFMNEAAESASDDDVTTHILVLAARGRVAAARGDAGAAEARCREALALAETTDDVNMHGDVLLDLGRVLAGAGDATGAAEALERARVLFELKGNLVQAAATSDQ